MSHGLVATYQVVVSPEKVDDISLQKLGRQIAIGQTIGTEKAEEVEALKPYMAEVVSVEAQHNGHETFAIIRIAFPEITVKSDMGTLLAVVFGKLSMAGKIRLVDLEFSQSLSNHFQGPRFGIDGIRELTGVKNGPLLMSIFKPCLGLAPATLAEMLYTQASAGVNLVKDDEILSDPDFETARVRLEHCLKASEKAEKETGRKTLYAINLTGPAEEILHRARTLAQDGATALLFNYLCYGAPLLNALRRDPDINVPLVAHPALAGAFYGSPLHGVSPQVLFGELPRLAGADLVLFPSPYGSVSLPLEEALAIKHALTLPNTHLKTSLPVPSAGIQATMVQRIMMDFGNDVVVNAGTGIYDFHDGAFAGVKSFTSQFLTTASLK